MKNLALCLQWRIFFFNIQSMVSLAPNFFSILSPFHLFATGSPISPLTSSFFKVCSQIILVWLWLLSNIINPFALFSHDHKMFPPTAKSATTFVFPPVRFLLSYWVLNSSRNRISCSESQCIKCFKCSLFVLPFPH